LQEASESEIDLPGLHRRTQQRCRTQQVVFEIGAAQFETRARGTAEIFALPALRVAPFFTLDWPLPLRISAASNWKGGGMRLWARIIVYLFLFAIWAGFWLVLAPSMAYSDVQQALYREEVKYNQAVEAHQKEMTRLKKISYCVDHARSLGLAGCEARYPK
jgi:hypothetical protein